MNLIEYYKEKGLSIEGRNQINVIVGIIMSSKLEVQYKRECIDFMRSLEEYLDEEVEE